MKTVTTRHFLLFNAYGKKLYHEAAAALPVIDPHNHIDIAALAANTSFKNIYQLWVKHDPYKHRAMRIAGVKEELITGDRPDYDKFLAWAECFTLTAGNPLFHWSCMELKQLFGIHKILSPETAPAIWETTNTQLNKKGFRALDMVGRFGVEMLCTSDDLNDSLEHHLSLSARQTIKCLPSLRGDNIIGFSTASFYTWLKTLQDLTGTTINEIDAYKAAIIKRIDFFDSAGCLLSDHSLDADFQYVHTDAAAAGLLFKNLLNRETLTTEEHIKLQSHLLHFLGTAYARRKWKMQLHIGAYRYTSTVLRNKVGPAGGYACMGNAIHMPSLCNFLDELDKQHALPKTILYTLNPADYPSFATLTGSYAEDGVKAKVQFGPAWWYNDHYEGIQQQLTALSQYGLLSTSIGMTTDSRSIPSFVRHDYYRRILCNMVGEWVEKGMLPHNWDFVSNMVKNIAYYNIKNWLQK